MATDPAAVVLLVSVATVRVATDAVKKAARRVVVLLASSLLSSVVDSAVAVAPLPLRRRPLVLRV